MNAQADINAISAINAITGDAEAPQSTALTVAERAAVALKSVKTERDFKALVEQSQSIVEITNSDGYKQCHATRMSLVRARTTLESLDEEVREDLVATNKAIIAERKRLVAIVKPEEDRLQKIQAAWDAIIAAEKRAKAEAEARRVAEIQGRIDALRSSPSDAVGKSSEEVGQFIQALESTAIDDSFAELRAQAEGAKSTALVRLRMMHTAAVNLETEQKRLADERAELKRQREAEELRQTQERLRQSRLTEISNIRGQVTVASLGRTGNGLTDRPGGTIDCIRETLDETRRWPITDERFGPEWEAARDAKADAVGQIERLLQQAEAREAEAKRLADEKAEQDAENARIQAAQDARDAEAAEQRRLQDEENERVRRHNEAALKKVTALHEQLSVAIRGREPDIKGGDVESFDQVIAETEALPITLEEFGVLIESARQTKAHTVNILKMRRVELIQQIADEAAAQAERHRLAAERAESDRKEAERIAAAQAEEKRIADERAQLEREQAELRAKQEAAAAPVSAPVPEASAPIVEAPAVIATTCNPCDAQDEREAAGVARHIDIVFDGPPGPVAGRFVEVEDERGHSIHIGEWIERGDGFWALRIPRTTQQAVSA